MSEKFAQVFKVEIFKALNQQNVKATIDGADQRPTVNFGKCLKVFYLIGYTYYEKELEEMLNKVIA